MGNDKKAITHKKLLLCEGKIDAKFFDAFLSRLKLEKEIQSLEYGGKDSLGSYLKKTLQADGKFPFVRSIGITRDADDNFNDASEAVDDFVKSAKLPARITVSKFILPNDKNTGALEALCLRAIQEKSPTVWKCIENFTKCLSSNKGCDCVPPLPPNKQDKRLIHAWLSSLPDPEVDLGKAAKEGFISFDSPVFGQLAEFLRQI
jgi:hypothetical protein